MASLILKPNREKSLLQRHPWVFSGAVDRLDGSASAGETVDVCSSRGDWLARAAFSPVSSIRGRTWTFQPEEAVDADFLRQRVRRALELRRGLIPADECDALRLVHAESDGLPGIIVDRYADFLVLQSLSAGADFWRETLADILLEETGISNIYERSDVDVRALEGMEQRTGKLRGQEPPAALEICENGLRFCVDLAHGQKTGFYLDQRRNRRRVGELCAGRRVLNCFSYTGGFSVYALAAGASEVLSIDSSADALELAAGNLRRNGLDESRAAWLEADVFQALRKLRDRAEKFDLVILDPPKFAPTAAQAEKAARGYKDINLLAFKLLNPSGLLATFSCSGGVSAGLFQKIVAGAAQDAGVDARILEHLHSGPDHPVALNFPEGEYLKGLICAV